MSYAKHAAGAKRQTGPGELAGEEDRFISVREAAHLIGMSMSWLWKAVRAGRFPGPVRLSDNCVRWRLSEVRGWMTDPAGWNRTNGQG